MSTWGGGGDISRPPDLKVIVKWEFIAQMSMSVLNGNLQQNNDEV